MRSWLAIGMLSAMSGCFYFDTINQRPGAQIEVVDPDQPAKRGGAYAVRALTDDPEGDYVTYGWRAYACGDAVPPAVEDCDAEPIGTGSTRQFDFTIARLRADGTPPRQVKIILEAADEYGAIARPEPKLFVPVVPALPTVQLEATSKYATVDNASVFVVGTPIDLFARVGDTDDEPGTLDVAWTVFNPQHGVGTLAPHDPEVLLDPDPNYRQYGKVLTPNQPGTWEVEVVANDPTSQTAMDLVSVVVAADGEPCLGAVQPAVPPTGSALPMSQPTLFRVPSVTDDLDPYPLVPNDPIFRAPKFQWSIQAPGGSTHVVVPSAAGNSLALDPANYRVGDVLEVRAQIYDRKATTIPCADGEATCSTISQPTCLQRQTWRVEVR